MTTTTKPSKACCTLPPIITHNYTPKGTYHSVANLRTYTTGPSTATHGILFITDVFGFYPQTLQGADLLAYANPDKPYRVYMPDWFEGEPMPVEWYPPDTEEKKVNMGGFFAEKARPGRTVDRIPGVLEAMKEECPEVKSWGIVGLCWGAKVANLVSMENSPFSAVAEAHPALLDPSDAPKITIPIIMLPSKDEDVEEVAAFEKALTVPHHVEIYDTVIHGYLSARADLEDEHKRGEYERGYKAFLGWFNKYL